MQHAVLLGRDNWMRVNTRSYRALLPRPHDSRVFGELALSHHATASVAAYAVDPASTNGGFHLLPHDFTRQLLRTNFSMVVRPFHVYSDACIDGFGAALEQEQADGSIKPIAYTSRATLDAERHSNPPDLEAGSIAWALKRLRGYFWGTKFCIFSAHNALKTIGKVGGP